MQGRSDGVPWRLPPCHMQHTPASSFGFALQVACKVDLVPQGLLMTQWLLQGMCCMLHLTGPLLGPGSGARPDQVTCACWSQGQSCGVLHKARTQFQPCL